jgi:hypothetical protein
LFWTVFSIHALELSAHLEPNQVAEGEAVLFILEIEGDAPPVPDLSPLEQDFHIADRRSQRSVSVVNGRRSSRYQLTLTLVPRRSGALEVPPIPVGDATTRPLSLHVSAPPSGAVKRVFPEPVEVRIETQSASAAPPDPPQIARVDESSAADGQTPAAIVECSAEPSQVRLKEQVVLTVRVLMDDSILRSQLRDPQIPNADVLPLGEDRYSAPVNGAHRNVYERRYALFPHAPGTMEVAPFVFEGWERDETNQATGFPPRQRPVYATSNSLSVEVLPQVTPEGDARWLPARNITLAESGPETYQVTTGEALERRISVRADGLISRSLPALSIDVPYQINESRQQPRLWDERRPQGVIGTRQEVFTLLTQEPGYYRLPPISLKWWNTDADRWEISQLPARNLVVTPAAFADVGGTRSPTTTNLKQWSESAPAASSPPAPITPESRERTVETQPTIRGNGEEASSLWVWLTAAFALGWLGTTAAWWRNRRRTAGHEAHAVHAEGEPVPEPADPLTTIIRQVRSAYEAGDAAGARNALLEWGGTVLPDGPPSNLARLAQRCPEPLRGQILLLEQAFFSPQPVHWERQRVWEHMRSFEPLPAAEPASFRRAKPLRRRTSTRNAS